LLLAKGANVNAENTDRWTPASSAIGYGRTEVAKLLLSVPDINVNAANNYGETLLHEACEMENTKIVKLLLAKGANVNAMTIDGETALDTVIENENTKIQILLLEAGANVNAADNNGKTPLHFAAEDGITKIVKLLLAKGANVNAADNNGKTPLHFAAMEGHTKIVKLLMDAGANLNAVNNDGETALDVARENGHTEVANAIIEESIDRSRKRILANRIETDKQVVPGLISRYLAFGRTKRQVSNKKSVANKTGLAKLKKTARKLGILVTTKRNGKRVYKPKSVLSKQIAVRKKMVDKKLKSFGRTTRRVTTKRPVSNKKSVANKTGLIKLKKIA